MKLIIDFQEKNKITFTTDDVNEKNHYALVKRDDENIYSLWWNSVDFVWENNFPDIETAVASVVGSLVLSMKIDY